MRVYHDLVSASMSKLFQLKSGCKYVMVSSGIELISFIIRYVGGYEQVYHDCHIQKNQVKPSGMMYCGKVLLSG